MRAILPAADETPSIDLADVSDDRLSEMARAGRAVAEVERVLAKTGDTLVGEMLRGQGAFYEWDHYPQGDIYDHETHAQYYYHAHPIEERFDGEHGHFHTFLRPKGMPPDCRPAPGAGHVRPADPNDALSHLVAVAMDRRSRAFRLFTTNRWVTGETWYAAGDVVRMLDRFEVDHARPSWPVNRWIGAMLRLFRPQAEALLAERDRTIANWQRHRQDHDALEDRRLEVTSSIEISVESQRDAVDAELRRRGPGALASA